MTSRHLTSGRLNLANAYLISDEDFVAISRRSKVDRWDVLLSMIGTVGEPCLIRDEPDFAIKNIGLFKSKGELEGKWLYYYLRSPRAQQSIRELSRGTTQQYIPLDALRRFPVAFPADTAEMRAIVRTLGDLDDKIELNRRMSQTLESMARALFKSWFVDFDPVRAKAEVRGTSLPPHLSGLFPDSLGETELGEIPAGWHTAPFADVLTELETGGRPLGGVSEYTTGVPSIGAESIVGLGRFDYSKTKFVPPEFFEAMSKGHVQSRDVLLYKDGGRPGEFEPHVTLFGDGFPFRTSAINEHVYRMRADELGQNLLFFWLSSDLVMEEMRTKGTGVAIPGLNSTQVKSLTTLVPAPAVARAFNRLVEPLVAGVLASCNESRSLTLLREALLPRLIAPEGVVA